MNLGTNRSKAQPKKLRIDDEQERKYHEKLLLRAVQISKSANLKWGTSENLIGLWFNANDKCTEQQLREEIDIEEE